jgi:hypothetical protein
MILRIMEALFDPDGPMLACHDRIGFDDVGESHRTKQGSEFMEDCQFNWPPRLHHSRKQLIRAL